MVGGGIREITKTDCNLLRPFPVQSFQSWRRQPGGDRCGWEECGPHLTVRLRRKLIKFIKWWKEVYFNI